MPQFSSDCEVIFSCAESIAVVNELKIVVDQRESRTFGGKKEQAHLTPQGFVEAMIVSKVRILASQARIAY